jgi:hypothetical protein
LVPVGLVPGGGQPAEAGGVHRDLGGWP